MIMLHHKVKKPKISISSIVQWGFTLVTTCHRDRRELEEAGFAWDDIERLSDLAKRCADLDAVYIVNRDKARLETVNINKQVREAKSLRNWASSELRRARRLCRSCPDVPSFRKDPPRTGLLQDLHNLAVLIDLGREPLSTISGFDTGLSETLRHESSKLSDAMAQSEVNRGKVDLLLLERNRCYAELYEAILELCSLGRSVFRGDVRVKDYRNIRSGLKS